MSEHHLLDAKTELVAKMAEMICESIPGAVLQLFAILRGGERSTRPILSVAV